MPTIAEIIESRYSRRNMLRTALRGTALMGGMSALSGCTVATLTQIAVDGVKNDVGATSPLRFTEISKGRDARHHLPAGYSATTLMRWGDSLHGSESFNPHQFSAAQQARSFGYNNDFTAYFPINSNSSSHGLLCVNHEYITSQLMFANGARMQRDRQAIATEMEALGASVVEVKRFNTGWKMVANSRYNRRISATTPMHITGPAAGDIRMRTRSDTEGTRAVGTFANCAGGQTPWGTYLSAEENIDGYFVGAVARGHREEANHKRMGIAKRSWYAWNKLDARFDVAQEPNEPNRFGWVVEIDPYDPSYVPVKRTALGRFKHEGATCVLAGDGRVVVYMGDDEAFEHVYKFVSRRAYNPDNRSANRDLLDDGVLYSARFDADGTLTWLPLLFGHGPLTPANGFANQADVLIEARRAADLLGATDMDRPEDVEVNPATGKLYIVMTKNTDRSHAQTDAANRRAHNKYGHIIKVSTDDHAHETMGWHIFMEGGDPEVIADRANYYNLPSSNGWLANPDNIGFDPTGHMWIATDGMDKSKGVADGLYACATQGQHRGQTKYFFRAPRGGEVCGPSFTPDGRTLFLAVQHPADEAGSTFATPSTRWPDFDPALPPRPSVIAITKDDGGVIGG